MEPTKIKDFPGRAVDAHLKATGLLPSEQADCECPNCGRLHRTLGFGKPPATRWQIAERQIGAALAPFALELHVDPAGNYSIVRKSTDI